MIMTMTTMIGPCNGLVVPKQQQHTAHRTLSTMPSSSSSPSSIGNGNKFRQRLMMDGQQHHRQQQQEGRRPLFAFNTVDRQQADTGATDDDDDNDENIDLKYGTTGMDGSKNSNSAYYKKKTRPVTAILDDLLLMKDDEDEEDTDGGRNSNDDDDDPLTALEWKQRELSSSLGILKQSLEEEKRRSTLLMARLEEAERVIAEQNQKLERSTREQFLELETLEAELKAQRRREEDKLKQERDQRIQQEALLQEAKALAQAQERALLDRVEQLQANLEAATKDSMETKREVDMVLKELSSAKNEINSLSNKLQTAQVKEETYQTKMGTLEEKLNVAQQKLAMKQQTLAKTERDLAQAKSRLDLKGMLNSSSSSGSGGSSSNNNADTSPSSIFSGGIFSNNNVGSSPRPAPKAVAPTVIKQIPPPTPIKTFVYPFINYWSVNPTTGEVTGIVRNHPQIADGTKIVTSGLANPRMALANAVVVTKSGSKYQLGMPSRVLDATTKKPTGNAVSPAPATPAPARPAGTDPSAGGSSSNNNNNNNVVSPLNFFSGIAGGVTDVSKSPPAPSPSVKSPAPAPQQQQQAQTQPQALEFPLTGESISNGRGTHYLLAGRAKRKPSGRSEIIMAYKADDDFKPVGEVMVVKLSTNRGKLEAEYSNYEKIQSRSGGGPGNNAMGLLGGIAGNNNPHHQPFVKCIDFIPRIEGSIKYAQHSALILERGEIDLREHRAGQTGPYEPALTKAALLTAVRCMDTMHKARLVYTDLKAENFIIMDTKHLVGGGDVSNIVIKGLDLESAVPQRGNPVDYTPEASPPEFAMSFLEGEAHEFVLDYSYDVWSFGMLAYELATGRGHFGKKPPAQIIKTLGTDFFQPPTVNPSVVTDEKLRDLIQKCLAMDPKKRPTTAQIINHPYFRGEGVVMPRLFGW